MRHAANFTAPYAIPQTSQERDAAGRICANSAPSLPHSRHERLIKHWLQSGRGRMWLSSKQEVSAFPHAKENEDEKFDFGLWRDDARRHWLPVHW
jgi:hypothetical protein